MLITIIILLFVQVRILIESMQRMSYIPSKNKDQV